jgi:hypothetical protein
VSTNNEEEPQPHPHHKLIEEIAERVEERIAAKFVRWMVGNVAAFVFLVVAGIAAFYDLKGDVKKSLERDQYQDQDIERIRDDTMARRQALDSKLESISQRIDEINRFLRDHNSAMLNGTRK